MAKQTTAKYATLREKISGTQAQYDKLGEELRDLKRRRRKRLAECISLLEMMTATDAVRDRLIELGALKENQKLTPEEIEILEESGRPVPAHLKGD